VIPKFILADARLWNSRLVEERKEQVQRAKKATKHGKAGADARWKDKDDTVSDLVAVGKGFDVEDSD
jgi:uncharacterized protein YdaU (DUF1376 family)